jgi:hypothetical protein
VKGVDVKLSSVGLIGKVAYAEHMIQTKAIAEV